ncbi:site-specific integrase [Escherichia coli]|nr:site-specific integrase [Escherichia coli]HAZ6610848.1 tyrosine-type recombinase/integrase [Escherichia coli]
MSTALATLAGKLAERVGMDSVDPQELITTLRQTAFKGDASDAQFIALLIVANQYGLKMRIDSKTSWLSACRRAGIEDFRFHDLRHTWASWLIQSGVPLSVLQEMGGWESIEMVRRYAHLAPNHLTEHARKIDDIFGDNVPNMSHSEIMEDIKKA